MSSWDNFPYEMPKTAAERAAEERADEALAERMAGGGRLRARPPWDAIIGIVAAAAFIGRVMLGSDLFFVGSFAGLQMVKLVLALLCGVSLVVLALRALVAPAGTLSGKIVVGSIVLLPALGAMALILVNGVSAQRTRDLVLPGSTLGAAHDVRVFVEHKAGGDVLSFLQSDRVLGALHQNRGALHPDTGRALVAARFDPQGERCPQIHGDDLCLYWAAVAGMHQR